MSALRDWLAHDRRCVLTENQQQDVINHIGCLCEMNQAVSDVLSEGVSNERNASNLAHTASVLAELSGALNGLLQTPPKC